MTQPQPQQQPPEPERPAPERCPACSKLFNLDAETGELHIYTKQPKFTHVEVYCPHCGTCFVGWDITLERLERYVNHFQVSVKTESHPDLDVIERYCTNHELPPIKELWLSRTDKEELKWLKFELDCAPLDEIWKELEDDV